MSIQRADPPSAAGRNQIPAMLTRPNQPQLDSQQLLLAESKDPFAAGGRGTTRVPAVEPLGHRSSWRHKNHSAARKTHVATRPRGATRSYAHEQRSRRAWPRKRYKEMHRSCVGWRLTHGSSCRAQLPVASALRTKINGTRQGPAKVARSPKRRRSNGPNLPGS